MTEDPPIHAFASSTAVVAAPAPAPFRKVFVALCTRDWLTEAHTSESVRAFGRVCKCEIEVRYMMNDGVARSRNNLAADALETDCTHIFFLDNDIIPEPWHLDRLLDADKDLICALYPKKQGTLEWVMNHLQGEKPDAEGRMKVRHAGTGAWLLKIDALRAHIAKHPEMEYTGDPSPTSRRWDLFPMHADKGRYLSEDWAFCERWLADGGEIWVDTKCQMRHIGKIVYPLQFTLSDDDMVDLMYHRYGVWPDLVRAFMGSGNKSPGLMGGHRERRVRLWPDTIPVSDLHQGDVLGGCFDVPNIADLHESPTLIDLGSDCGAFVRWAQKRWNGPTIHAYEARPDIFQQLEVTAEGLKGAGTKATIHISGDALTNPEAIAALPKATIIKIDLPGRDREIVDALHFAKRLPEFDCILLKYSDDLGSFFVKTIIEQTHVLHGHQRYGANVGIMKFIRRELIPAAQA